MKTNNINKSAYLSLIIGFMLLLNCSVFAQHKKYTSADMPQTVIDSFNKIYPDATALGYDIERENGGKFYEIESMDGDIRRDLLYNADGSISEIEEQINIGDLPDNIVSSVNSKYPKGTISKAERVTKGSDTLYEVVVKTGKKKLEVRLNSNGDVVNEDND